MARCQCTRGAVLHAACRLLVSAHFVYELVDKVTDFPKWREAIAAQAGLGVWSLWLVIALLAVGSACLLLAPGRYLPVAVVALAIFQIPTSVLFEDSLYESFDSVSALGGVLAIAVAYRNQAPPHPETNRGMDLDRRDDSLLSAIYS